MLSVVNDCGAMDTQLQSTCDLAKLLNPNHAGVYGPSNEQLEEAETHLDLWKKEVEIAKSVSKLAGVLYDNIEKGLISDFEVDAPEQLQIAAAFALCRKNDLEKEEAQLCSAPIPKQQKTRLKNVSAELSKHLSDIETSFLDIRQKILFEKGSVTEFRASRENILRLVELSNNTNVDGDFEFEEV